MPPKTQYTKSGKLNIAYQVAGDGPIDVVYVPGWVSHVEEAWEFPALAAFLTRLASFSRLILFDKRGTGMSDRVPLDALPTLEERMDDVRAVMDAVGSSRAAVFGFSEGGNMSILFAATYPGRTIALVTFGVFAKRLHSDDYPWAPTLEQRQREIDLVEREWGDEMDLATLVPSRANDQAFKRQLATYFRRSASPGAAAALLRMNTFIDVRHALHAISVPALILHRRGDRDANVEEGRYIAARIPEAKFVELPGEDHLPWVGDSDGVLDEIEEFLTGVRPATRADRVLATVLFTDIVGATETAVAFGDRRWKELLESYYALVRRQLRRFRGHEVDTAGDGFLSTFDGPGRAIGCAVAISQAMPGLGCQIRAGLHTGEVEVVGGKVQGIAVHIGARVAALGQAGDVLVSSTVKDLVSGSGIAFHERGMHTLKGVPGIWQLFDVDPTSVPLSRA